ncbi:MAG TPA: MgtC/SapB family protein [Bryobacteraceae bacterium]|nr:MgtC/SapB family protein [Bryobacteraceae bacterium]
MYPTIEFHQPAWIAMGEALLIGLLVGIEREADQRLERHAGLRDFVTIGLAGGLCGVIGQPALTIAVLIALTALIVVFRAQTPGRTGITTELAGVATFLLCVLTATASLPWGSPLAIALTVVLALFLDMRVTLQKFFVEVITEREFHETLRFLAVIFVILPVLPDGDYGPYGFFNPQKVWIFVILVCTINWLGYFLQKFLGGSQGLRWTAVVGGVASTTAATSAFAKQCAEDEERTLEYGRAAVLANAVQFPRIYALMLVASPALAAASIWPLIAMGAAGVVYAFLAGIKPNEEQASNPVVRLGNPFHLMPALKFGAAFAIIRLMVRASSAEFGEGGVLSASFVGGSVDADAIVFSVSGLLKDSGLAMQTAVGGVFLALVANAGFKTFLAYSGGTKAFGGRVALGFLLMFSAGAAAWVLQFARG